MYDIIHRILLGVLLLCFALLFMVVKPKLKTKKGLQIVYWFFAVAVSLFISDIPYENIFVHFDTTEKAFAYRTGNKKITYKYEGDNACWITYTNKEGAEVQEAFYLTENGWALAPWPAKAGRIKIISSPTQQQYLVLLSHIKK